jgi:hypothetical protein
LEKPKPSQISDILFSKVFGLNSNSSGGSGAHLVVKLSTPSAPVNTNGRWDETNRCVLWEADLEQRTDTNCVPTVCYASWSQPDEPYQRQHFGRILLSGESLVQYCLWRGGLNEKQAGEWEALLAGLQASEKMDAKVQAFRFSEEPPQPASESQPQPRIPSTFPRELIHAALQKPPPAGTR